MAGAITGTAALETGIMDLWEQGRSKQQIARELGLSLVQVNRVFGYMVDAGEHRRYRANMIAGSIALARALHKALGLAA